MLLANCEDNDDLNPDAVDCTKVSCTNDIRALYVSLKDKSGVLVPLDLFTVTKKEDGKDITPNYSAEELESYRRQGSYLIFSDFSPENQKNATIRVIFKAFIDSKEVVQEEFVVGSDCCHVLFVERNNNLVVD